MDEQLTTQEKDKLIHLVHDEMDKAGARNDDEMLKELAAIARKLGDGQ